ncbi:putative porin [Pseudomonas sp. JDS28PS106]|uniref:putative porin n=1 Tax=Pseudomonas sp. JDS28PS106 TaxID=2497235 RepID=UPI002FD2AAE6
MRPVYTRTAAALCGGLALAMSLPASAAVDAKLLEMLRANGSINQAQYAELQTELAKDQQAAAAAQSAKSQTMSEFEKKIAWAAKTQIKGDVRLRQENIDVQGEPDNGGVDKNRQRIRARLGAYSEINPQVDAGIRIASGSSADARSTNQDMNNYFNKKSLWLDLAYIDYHPDAIENLHIIGGKMNQPWVNMGDVIWDGDINPEGLALTYKLPLGGKTELFGSVGHYTLEDNVDGEGVEFKNDLRLYSGQLGAKFAATDNLKFTLGGSVYGYDNDTESDALSVNGNTTTEFRLYEGFGQIDIGGLPMPLSLYGQYVVNDESTDDQDTAWLAGLKTGFYGVKLDYNYRDVQRNAVVGAFTDSDFALGTTGSRGHKIKLGYDIDKNFSIGATYFMANADYVTDARRDADADVLQLDAEVKF